MPYEELLKKISTDGFVEADWEMRPIKLITDKGEFQFDYNYKADCVLVITPDIGLSGVHFKHDQTFTTEEAVVIQEIAILCPYTNEWLLGPASTTGVVPVYPGDVYTVKGLKKSKKSPTKT